MNDNEIRYTAWQSVSWYGMVIRQQNFLIRLHCGNMFLFHRRKTITETGGEAVHRFTRHLWIS